MKFLVSAIIFLNAFSAFADTGFPKLFFSYSALFDEAVCDQPVQESWAKEAVVNEPRFTSIWEAEASDLFNAIFKKFKGRFSRKEMTATLSVCPQFISFSDPLAIKVTWYLKSYMGDKPLASDVRFIETVFHELLHTWVSENLKQSALLKKYKNESSRVKSHLHLMAVEQYAYIAANKTDLLEYILTHYPSKQDDYARAWEIVQKEGYELFLREFD